MVLFQARAYIPEQRIVVQKIICGWNWEGGRYSRENWGLHRRAVRPTEKPSRQIAASCLGQVSDTRMAAVGPCLSSSSTRLLPFPLVTSLIPLGPTVDHREGRLSSSVAGIEEDAVVGRSAGRLGSAAFQWLCVCLVVDRVEVEVRLSGCRSRTYSYGWVLMVQLAEDWRPWSLRSDSLLGGRQQVGFGKPWIRSWFSVVCFMVTDLVEYSLNLIKTDSDIGMRCNWSYKM